MHQSRKYRSKLLEICIWGLLLVWLAGCGGAQIVPYQHEMAFEELVDVDRAFSDLSSESGMVRAFLEYSANNAVLLRPGRDPIVGRDAVEAFLGETDFSGHTLTWTPRGGRVAESGDLGFTYGTYELRSGDQRTFGTYVSIWEKDENGNWKWVLDTGNPGLSDD